MHFQELHKLLYEPCLGVCPRPPLEGFADQRERIVTQERNLVPGMLRTPKGISTARRYREDAKPRYNARRAMPFPGIRQLQDASRVGMRERTSLESAAADSFGRFMVPDLCSQSAINVGGISNPCAPSWRRSVLSDEYTNRETKLRWQCTAGHEWFAKPGEVKRGSWCR